MEDKICSLSKELYCSARGENGDCMLYCYSQYATCEYAIVPTKAKEGTTCKECMLLQELLDDKTVNCGRHKQSVAQPKKKWK